MAAEEQQTSRGLLDLPVELFTMITGYLVRSPDDSALEARHKLQGLLSLCRTSKRFHQRFTSVLFQHIKLDLRDAGQSYALIRHLFMKPWNREDIETIQIILRAPSANPYHCQENVPSTSDVHNALRRLPFLDLPRSRLGKAKRAAVYMFLMQIHDEAYITRWTGHVGGHAHFTRLVNLDMTLLVLFLLCRNLRRVQIMSDLNRWGLHGVLELLLRVRLVFQHIRPSHVPHIEVYHGVDVQWTPLRPPVHSMWTGAFSMYLDRVDLMAVAPHTRPLPITMLTLSRPILSTGTLKSIIRLWLTVFRLLEVLNISIGILAPESRSTGTISTTRRARSSVPTPGRLLHFAVRGWREINDDFPIEYFGPLQHMSYMLSLKTLHVPIHFLFERVDPATDQTLVTHLPTSLRELYLYHTRGWWDNEPLSSIYTSIDLLIKTPAFAALEKITFDVGHRQHDHRFITGSIARTVSQREWHMTYTPDLLVLHR